MWSDSPAELRETFTLAVWVGYVTRALDFANMLKGAPLALTQEWNVHIAAVLRHWQEAHALLNQHDHFLTAIER